MDEILKSLIAVLPYSPGIYQFLDSKGTIIYIGKAKSLRKRVSSYFNKTQTNTKTDVLVKKIADIRHIVTNTEVDALLLENNLIKKYQPRYNVMLKDDKSYPWICIRNERFPRVFFTRKVIKDGSQYYGPYTSVTMARTILDLCKRLFKLRTCNLTLSATNIAGKKFKECLEFHINNCKAPCTNKQQEEEYNAGIASIQKILKGNIFSVIQHLKSEMLKFAEEYKFEEANNLKEKLKLLEAYQSKSTVVNPAINNVDVFSIIADEKYAFANYMKVINGSIIQAQTFELVKKLNEEVETLLPLVITEVLQRNQGIVTEILVPFPIDFPSAEIAVIVPKRGDKKSLIDLSIRNAELCRQEHLKQFETLNPLKAIERKLKTMQDDLHLTELPYHIECFDNSNLQGSYPVSACVVFREAKPSKKDYRHFNVKTVEGIDDFATMQEVVYRRYSRLLNENKQLPQLVVIDGGKGQLSAAMRSLQALNITEKITVIGIAKRLEEIYFPNDPIPLYLDKNSETLRVIQHIRDEAHRFGVSFHRDKRLKGTIKTSLTEIEGIGEKTAMQLLTQFKSYNNVVNASLSDLEKSIGTAKAKIVYNHAHPQID